ncbi:MAG: radical SAM protein [bacterium]
MHVVLAFAAFENLGIEYLAAVLERAGHRVSLAFDPVLFNDGFVSFPTLARLLDSSDRIADRIAALEPDLVGLGVLSPAFPWALRLARKVKRRRDVPIVLGGVHPTAVPERVLRNPEIDFVIRGEGEDAIVELVDALASGAPTAAIQNLAFRKPGTGEVQVNPVRPLIADLDTLPFPNKNLYLAEARGFQFGYPIMAQRGCSYSCSFCHHWHGKRLYRLPNSQYVRQRSVANVIDELSQAKEHLSPRSVRFEDETFTESWPWVEEFCASYRDTIGLPFFCLARPDTIHEHVVKALADAGCRSLEVGVQSFDPQVRSRVAYRGESDEEVRRSLRLARQYDVPLGLDVILNLPLETEAGLVRSLLDLVDDPPAEVNAFYCAYYPGTAVLDIAREQGLLDHAAVERILDGESVQRVALGGYRTEAAIRKLGMLFVLTPYLPAGIIRWFAAKRRYRFLPHPGYTAVWAVVGYAGRIREWWRARGKRGHERMERFEAIRTPERYATYLVRRVWPGFRRGTARLPFRQPESARLRTGVAPRPHVEQRGEDAPATEPAMLGAAPFAHVAASEAP